MRQHSCHSAAARSAAGAPADGAGWRAERVRACRAAYGAIRPLPRCAAPRAHLYWHTRLPNASAAAHRRRPSLRRWLVCARLVTAERSRARSRGALGPVAAPGGVLLPRASATCYCRACTPPVAAAGGAPVDVDATPVTRTLVDQLVWTLVASFVNNRKMRSRCDVISGSLCSLVHTRTATHVTHRFHITISPHTTHTRHTPTSHIR